MGISSDLLLDKRRANEGDSTGFKIPKWLLPKWQENTGIKGLLERPRVAKWRTNGKEKREREFSGNFLQSTLKNASVPNSVLML
jgi:hypothetical protein